MSDVEKFFNSQIRFKELSEIVDRIRKEHQKLCGIDPKQKKRRISEVAGKIRSEICECSHPVARKMFDWGYLKGRTSYARDIKQVIQDLLDRNITSFNDVKNLKEKINKLRMGMMKDVKQKIKKSKDIRPEHAPGSVSYGEARNLYFGEFYDSQALYKLGTQLMNSICIGRDIAIYFDNQDLLEDLQEELIREFDAYHILGKDLGRLKIHQIEGRQPYLVFMKFLLWLYGHIEVKRLHHIVNLLKETQGTIYFAPGREKVNYSTIPLPRLDFFFTNWLEVSERRKTLEKIRDELFLFMQKIENSARRIGESQVVRNKIDLLTTYYNAFCAYLLRSSFINHECLRSIIDIVLELSDHYKVDVSLSFIKDLVSK